MQSLSRQKCEPGSHHEQLAAESSCGLNQVSGPDAFDAYWRPELDAEVGGQGSLRSAEHPRAQVLAGARGAFHPCPLEAERLAREALAITEDTDGLNDQGEALCDLAEILVAAGRGEEAAEALAAALERFERKENIPMARRTRTQLTALRAGTSSV